MKKTAMITAGVLGIIAVCFAGIRLFAPDTVSETFAAYMLTFPAGDDGADFSEAPEVAALEASFNGRLYTFLNPDKQIILRAISP